MGGGEEGGGGLSRHKSKREIVYVRARYTSGGYALSLLLLEQ